MQENTVLLSLQEYNELRDFKKEVEEKLTDSKFAVIEEGWGSMFGGGYIRKYYTENEAVVDFEKRNKELEAENKKLEAENKELEAKIEKSGIEELIEISINDLKKMSYWEFRKWRNS